MIGINQLLGEEENIERPLTLGRVKRSEQTRNEDEDSQKEAQKVIQVCGEIKKKIVFKHRPVPIMAQSKPKTSA